MSLRTSRALRANRRDKLRQERIQEYVMARRRYKRKRLVVEDSSHDGLTGEDSLSQHSSTVGVVYSTQHDNETAVEESNESGTVMDDLSQQIMSSSLGKDDGNTHGDDQQQPSPLKRRITIDDLETETKCYVSGDEVDVERAQVLRVDTNDVDKLVEFAKTANESTDRGDRHSPHGDHGIPTTAITPSTCAPATAAENPPTNPGTNLPLPPPQPNTKITMTPSARRHVKSEKVVFNSQLEDSDEEDIEDDYEEADRPRNQSSKASSSYRLESILHAQTRHHIKKQQQAGRSPIRRRSPHVSDRFEYFDQPTTQHHHRSPQPVSKHQHHHTPQPISKHHHHTPQPIAASRRAPSMTQQKARRHNSLNRHRQYEHRDPGRAIRVQRRLRDHLGDGHVADGGESAGGAAAGSSSQSSFPSRTMVGSSHAQSTRGKMVPLTVASRSSVPASVMQNARSNGVVGAEELQRSFETLAYRAIHTMQRRLCGSASSGKLVHVSAVAIRQEILSWSSPLRTIDDLVFAAALGALVDKKLVFCHVNANGKLFYRLSTKRDRETMSVKELVQQCSASHNVQVVKDHRDVNHTQFVLPKVTLDMRRSGYENIYQITISATEGELRESWGELVGVAMQMV